MPSSWKGWRMWHQRVKGWQSFCAGVTRIEIFLNLLGQILLLCFVMVLGTEMFAKQAKRSPLFLPALTFLWSCERDCGVGKCLVSVVCSSCSATQRYNSGQNSSIIILSSHCLSFTSWFLLRLLYISIFHCTVVQWDPDKRRCLYLKAFDLSFYYFSLQQ